MRNEIPLIGQTSDATRPGQRDPRHHFARARFIGAGFLLRRHRPVGKLIGHQRPPITVLRHIRRQIVESDIPLLLLRAVAVDTVRLQELYDSAVEAWIGAADTPLPARNRAAATQLKLM